MDIEYLKQHAPIGGKWIVTNILGKGAFGVVAEIVSGDSPEERFSLEAISVPESKAVYEHFCKKNPLLTDEEIRNHYRTVAQEYVKIYTEMAKISGDGIVEYKDYEISPKKDYIGWDVFVRTEPMQPVDGFLKGHCTRQAATQLGMDICRSLETCLKYGLVLKSISLENVYVCSGGKFKLGDYISPKGIASSDNKNIYLSPEVYADRDYDETSALYSLGIIMYKLLNNNLEPFRKSASYDDGEKSLDMRMCAARMSAPANADAHLSEIILKACEFKMAERYCSPAEMRLKLEALVNGTYVTESYAAASKKSEAHDIDETKKVKIIKKSVSSAEKMGSKESVHTKKSAFEKKRKKSILIVCSAVGAALICVFVALLAYNLRFNSLYVRAGVKLRSGNYEEAKSIFEDISGYKDSEKMIYKCDYEKAESLLKAGNYDEALEIFENLKAKGYSDSKERVVECQLLMADSYISEGKTQEAFKILNRLSDDGNRKAKEMIDEHTYDAALLLYNEEKYPEAKVLFENLNDENMITECNYKIAEELKSSGEFVKAMSMFAKLGDYSDSKIQFESVEANLSYENQCDEFFSDYNNFKGKYQDEYGYYVEYSYDNLGNESTSYNLTYDESSRFKVDDSGIHYHRIAGGGWKKQWIFERTVSGDFEVYNYLDKSVYTLKAQ